MQSAAVTIHYKSGWCPEICKQSESVLLPTIGLVVVKSAEPPSYFMQSIDYINVCRTIRRARACRESQSRQSLALMVDAGSLNWRKEMKPEIVDYEFTVMKLSDGSYVMHGTSKAEIRKFVEWLLKERE